MRSKELFAKIKSMVDEGIPVHAVVSVPADKFAVNLLTFPGIYLLYSRRKLVYIGCSEDVGIRIMSHPDKSWRFRKQSSKHRKSVLNKITGIKIIRFDDAREAFFVEEILIDVLHPDYNAKYNRSLFMEKRSERLSQLANEIADELKKSGGPRVPGSRTR